MDFPLSSSVILVVAVALWIVWVAPYILRNRQLQVAGELMAESAETAEPQAGTVMIMNAQQETPMDTRKSSESVSGNTHPEVRHKSELVASRTARQGAFRIRYGRSAIALLGFASLLIAPIAGVLRIFGIGTAWLPGVALLAGIAAVALLRRLAVRDRRARVDAAFSAAMSAPAGHGRSRSGQAGTVASAGTAEASSAKLTENVLFDAEAGLFKLQPLTAGELRAAALAEAVASGDTSVRAPKLPDAAAGAEWEPVEVPKPTYVEAAKADRPAPEPLDLPDAPKAVGKPSLKQGAAAAPAVAQSKPLTKAQSALSNLDDVLQRRRA
ncbi:hypothetical protein [Pseudarthrobacter sp. N5]|uniref:hypothetical protein n=1 Tax=Pseudarthrobacter sp. N5 TaxID=3418416 RepID=UPI003CEF7A1D